MSLIKSYKVESVRLHSHIMFEHALVDLGSTEVWNIVARHSWACSASNSWNIDQVVFMVGVFPVELGVQWKSSSSILRHQDTSNQQEYMRHDFYPAPHLPHPFLKHNSTSITSDLCGLLMRGKLVTVHKYSCFYWFTMLWKSGWI